MRGYLQTLTAVLTLALALTGEVAGAETPAADDPSPKAPGQRSVGLKSASDLRGSYFSSAGAGSGAPVGRLAILLLSKDGSSREVNLHHRFHTGDGFRFVVSSNQDGWLYVLHRSPGGEPQLLWPLQDEEQAPDLNQVRTGRKRTVPPRPGKFIFDDEVGNEYFYVVIRPERQPPELSVMAGESSDSAPEASVENPLDSARDEVLPGGAEEERSSLPSTSKQRIVQFSIRGSNRPIRGVIFDPGPQDTDPHTYFSTPPEDDALSNVLEFQLRHER